MLKRFPRLGRIAFSDQRPRQMLPCRSKLGMKPGGGAEPFKRFTPQMTTQRSTVEQLIRFEQPGKKESTRIFRKGAKAVVSSRGWRGSGPNQTLIVSRKRVEPGPV